MNYLIVQQWPSTKGNHAGMSHMCDMLVSLYPDQYKKIELDDLLFIPQRRFFLTSLLFSKFDQWRYARKFHKKQLKEIRDMLLNLKVNDSVFLLEYHLLQADQIYLATFLKKHYPKVRRIGLSHLTPSNLVASGFTKEKLIEWSNAIDLQLTLGSSLSHYFESIGISKDKIQTGFHYVDSDYYKPNFSIFPKTRPVAIAMGNLQRNFQLLADIVQETQCVDWIICCGDKYSEMQKLFKSKANIQLKNRLPEAKLKALMEQADISINVLDDTVGSNVITTSMAMGLAIVASDVGSIRDYCDESNCIFCKNTMDDFKSSITNLTANTNLMKQMQKSSLKKSQKFKIGNIHRWFNQL